MIAGIVQGALTPLYSRIRFGQQPQQANSAQKPWPTLQPDLFAPRRKKDTPGYHRFAVIGDPGSGTRDQRKVGEQMARTYQNKPFATVLVMGDNVYEDGEPELFENRIYTPYKPLFEKGVRFYPIMGNHDVELGFGNQQMAYWGAPQFYSIKLGRQVELFAIDTTVMVPGYEDCHVKNPGLAKQIAADQLKWLEKALGDSKAKFKVVYGHYPLYASGDVSEKANWREKLINDAKAARTMRRKLEPLLKKHGVDLYLTAHEHHYERSKLIKGIQHILTGAAGKLRDVFHLNKAPYPRQKLIAHKNHFMLFEVTRQGLAFQVISKKGNILDEGLIRKP